MTLVCEKCPFCLPIIIDDDGISFCPRDGSPLTLKEHWMRQPQCDCCGMEYWPLNEFCACCGAPLKQERTNA
jgi:hypothetical protein